MKTARIILALLFVMGGVATLFSKIENSGKFAPAKIPDKIYFEEHDGGILIIYVKDGGKTYRIDTRSSVYSKYKIRQVSKDFLFLDSSDIGKYMITDAVSKKLGYLPREGRKNRRHKRICHICGKIRKGSLGTKAQHRIHTL